MRRYLSRLTILLAGFLLLTSCAAQPGPADPSILPTQAEPITLTVWTYYNGDQLTSFNNLVAEFNATVGVEEGILIESQSHGSVNDLENNVLAAVQGKVGAEEVPHIFAAYADTAYAVDQLGLVADLSPYLSEEALSNYMDSYINEGRFSGDGSIKIFPVAKSTEVLLLNKTDWDLFAAATGATYDDLATIESLTATAQAYYEWTDSLTDAPNDGSALFGRDAIANYFLIGAMQLGVEVFSVENGVFHLNYDHDVVHKLWDNYYIPYVKGYFASAGRFRSDDVKTGNILAFVGSSSGATFFPSEVIHSDTERHSIEMAAFPAPQFAESQPYAVQQGAGMVVTKGSEEEVRACVRFLTWFTQDERNIRFSVDSGYLPVTKTANDMNALHSSLGDVSPTIEAVLSTAMDTVQGNTLYTPNAFSSGTSARSILERSMHDLARADRQTVVELLAQGQTLEEATAQFTGDDYFEAWYQETLAQLEALS